MPGPATFFTPAASLLLTHALEGLLFAPGFSGVAWDARSPAHTAQLVRSRAWMLDPPLGLESVFFPNLAVLAPSHSEKPFGGPLLSMPRLRPGLFSSDFFDPDHEVSSALKYFLSVSTRPYT